ncbi:N-carbamoyl-L-amino-acid hydrolase [Mumia flava]|uniref:N-carbamoyl-L-amino-acid hydrolase n=1 Tax=Mumia flava TaxID=1348852 RepID=A0A2M9BEZ9_9ACTN|nr:allantoate amidohydrolase [Mumia flava]PJJ56522.1 N-carbamoyl-L-amino-acid hydrolase [Mumia flava]
MKALDAIADVGRDRRTGGYRRFAWSDADLELREWFAGEAAARSMELTEDGNGNQVAWWQPALSVGRGASAASDRDPGVSIGDSSLAPASTTGAGGGSDPTVGRGASAASDRDPGVSIGDSSLAPASTTGAGGGSDPTVGRGASAASDRDPSALLLGSHLDSVPDGGAYDGPLGVVSAFAAVDRLRAEGFVPSRPIAVACFADEEGARFGVACAGSRLAAGTLAPDRALALRDVDGDTLADVLRSRGRDPYAVGRAGWLDRIGTFVELHVEQGRALVHSGDAVGVSSAIWPHGRWRLDLRGRADHAGTTPMGDRCDPMPVYARTVLAATEAATRRDARATFGKLRVHPGGANAIPSAVAAWLDARAADDATLERLVAEITDAAREAGDQAGIGIDVTAESTTPTVTFDPALTDRLARLLDAPVLPTGAGHDAGVLSATIPTTMLFVRNPTGVSHSPDEHAEDADCDAGVAALADVVRDLA